MSSRWVPQRAFVAWLHLCIILSSVGNAFTTASKQQNAPTVSSVPMGGSAVSQRTGLNETDLLTTTSRPKVQAFASSMAQKHAQTPELVIHEVKSEQKKGPLKILFLSSDTGGGHRASAEALAKQFQFEYPGTTYDLLDVWTKDGVYPYKTLVKSYKHLSAHPRQWRFFYHLSNTRLNEKLSTIHANFMCEKKIRRTIASYNPDVVISVHPTMNSVPLKSTRKISKALGKHIPFFTVVTDFGSGHGMWFSRKVEKVYVASDRIRNLAKRRGKTPEENIVMTGLPIRHDFAVEAERLGDRTSPEGKAYQKQVRAQLGLDPDKKMVLVMGGGEGVGSLSDIVNELYAKMTREGVDATICVVCGRNEKLKKDLEERDWNEVLKGTNGNKLSKRQRLYRMFHRKEHNPFDAHRSPHIQESLDHALDPDAPTKAVPTGKVDVIGLGFVTNMASYMSAADVLVSKAGPGTIAEAASVGLPIMLTSYLPGQEAGNVDIVLEGGFGDYCEVPEGIAAEVTCWLQDTELLDEMSSSATSVGHPHAAEVIAKSIGDITHSWMEVNEEGKLS